MKRKNIIIGAIAIIAVIGIYFGINMKNDKANPIVPVDGVTLQQKIDEKESFVFYVYQDTCGACITFKPILTTYLQDHNYQVSSMEISQNAKEEDALVAFDYIGEQLLGTPQLFVFEKGELVSTVAGVQQPEELDSFFHNYTEYLLNKKI